MTKELERWYGVHLSDQHVGDIVQKGNVTRFIFADDYWDREDRKVLGLWFEDNPGESPCSSVKLPSWFSNLLPEGKLREWIAHDQGVSTEKELSLLLRIGSDLPGAVIVDATARDPGDRNWRNDHFNSETTQAEPDSPWKFSLAGVGMKFSMLQQSDRLVLPAKDTLGDWIVKLPEKEYAEIPSNEAAMMSLAQRVGINIPEHRLVHRDEISSLPDTAWTSTENVAYAVKRFDRDGARRIHIEDFAQLRGKYPGQKYDGSFETVAAFCYRANDLHALQEWARRIAFNLAIGNGDAHLKNWSLIYPDGNRASLSPAYDLVATLPYISGEDFGLKFTGTKHFQRIRSGGFADVAKHLNATHANLEEIASETLSSIPQYIQEIADLYPKAFATLSWVAENTAQMRSQLKL